ncbi:MAG: flagellar basal-body MS-ring/collar protein FliF [Pseudomonadota bacterium]
MNGAIEFVRTLGPGRLSAMGAVAFGLFAFLVFFVMRVSTPEMAPLFTDLTVDDSASVVSELESRNVQYEIRQNGAAVLVPEDQVLRLRISLAEEGLPAGGTVGYEIFDNRDTLGSTSFVQGINRVRALEGELARTIRAIDRIQMARVHLVLPERQLFSRETPDPSASIVVKARGILEGGQIRAIQHLVASAVTGLKPNNISIIDENGTLLASATQDGDEGFLATTMEERNTAFESRLRSEITGIVSSVVGAGGARVQVAAELDFNRVTETQDIFDPDGRVVRSTQTREESSAASDRDGPQGVTVGNELPDADGGTAGDAGSQESTNATEEIINYEISRTTRTQVTEAGSIKRISVAVLVDGTYAQNEAGDVIYTPRGEEELQQIATLVRSAIGFDANRGDTVEVVNLQFAATAAPAALEAEPTIFLGLTRDDLFRIGEIAAMLIVALLVLLTVVRPLINRIIAPLDDERPNGTEATAQLTGPDGQPALPAPDEQPTIEEKSSAALDMIEVAQINGEMQASTIKKVGELVNANPDEAVTIVRQWMNQAA